MHFLLENDMNEKFNYDLMLVEEKIKKNKYLHSYEKISISDFYKYEEDVFWEIVKTNKLKDKNEFPDNYKNSIPIGSINFVSYWLKIFHNIEKENPIEIPPILRTDEFLKRKYSIVPADKLPRKGRFFIKNVSKLKDFTYSGELEYFLFDEMFEPAKNKNDNSLRINPSDLFQVSEIVNVLSEYRVYIIGGEIENIANYNGDVTLFPDIDLIRKANNLYSTQKDYPKSYSMDVMITQSGTAITEIHNYTSLGHYSTMFGDNLLYAYRDGIDYLINHNTEITEFSNF